MVYLTSAATASSGACASTVTASRGAKDRNRQMPDDGLCMTEGRLSPENKLDLTGLRLSPAFDLEAKATAEGMVEGLGAVFGGEPDSYGDTIAPGAFSASLARHSAEGTVPIMLWSHDVSRPVGRWERLAETQEGLAVRGRLNMRTEAGREAYEHLRAGDLSGLSIGFYVAKGGAEREGSTRVLKTLDLQEVSLVSLPANRRARVRQVNTRLR